MEQREVDLLKIFKILWVEKVKIILFVFLATLLSIIISLMLPKWYKAQAVMLSPQNSSSSFNPMNLLGDLGIGSIIGGNENSFRYLAILKSRSLREEVIKEFDLINHYKSINMEKALEALDGNLHFEIGDEFQIIVSILDKNQEMVADMTNYIVNSLDSINIELSVLNAKNNRVFMGERVQAVLDSLEESSESLKKFMEKNGILSFEDQVVAGVEQASIIQAALIQKEVELEVVRKTLSEDNPVVDQLRIEINSLQNKFNDFLKNNTIESLIPNFSQVPSLQLKLIKLQRQVEYYSRILEYLGPLYEQQKIEEAKNIPTIQVLDEAVRPELKTKPKRSRIVILTFILASFISSIYYIVINRD